MQNDFIKSARLLWLGAAGALLAGAGFAFYNLATMPTVHAKIQTRLVVWQQLHELQMLRQQENNKLAVLESWPRPVQPAPLEPILRSAGLTNPAPELIARGIKKIPRGWQIQQVEMRLHDIPLAVLPVLLAALSTQQPPWILESCHVSASPQQSGAGEAILVLHALADNAPPPAPAQIEIDTNRPPLQSALSTGKEH